MKILPIILLFLSFSVFADRERYNFERNEIRLHRDRGETKDYGGYWAAPTPQINYDRYRNETDAHRRALESAIESDRRKDYRY